MAVLQANRISKFQDGPLGFWHRALADMRPAPPPRHATLAQGSASLPLTRSIQSNLVVALRIAPKVRDSGPSLSGSDATMQGVFPEALSSLKNADPELFSIIEDEKERQW